MATALAMRSGLDPGKIGRTVGREYTGARRNVKYILESVEHVVSKYDYHHIKRIPTTGCPTKLEFEESQANKLKMIQRGNQKSVLDYPRLVDNIFNREDRYSHVIPLHDWVYTLGPHLRHNSQGIVDMKRQVWDGSTKRSRTAVVMNDHTPTEDEADINFGTAKHDFTG